MKIIKTIAISTFIAATSLLCDAREFQDWSNFRRYHDSNTEVKGTSCGRTAGCIPGQLDYRQLGPFPPRLFQTERLYRTRNLGTDHLSVPIAFP